MITGSKIIELFYMADDFCRFFDARMAKYMFRPASGRAYQSGAGRLLRGVSAIMLLMFFGAALSSAGAKERAYRKGFLYREGTQLMLDGRKYTCASFNSFQMSGCGDSFELFTHRQIDSIFALLPEGMMVRTWAFPGNEDNAERLIKSAERNGIKLILALGDGRSSCGHHDGAKNGDGSGKTPAWYKTGYKAEYLPHVIRMTRKFRNSPAIGMWEIINEPADADVHTLKHFLDTVAHVIKTNDPHHLVESGTFAGWAYGGIDNYRLLHSGKDIDVANIHDYDYDYNRSDMIESPHFRPCIDAARSLNKPFIVGEAGIQSGGGCRTDRKKRAEAMRRKFDVYIGKGASAVLVWNLANGVRKGCELTFSPNDPLMSLILEYAKYDKDRQ